MKIILASASPRRKELLQQIGLDFEVITSNADEDIEYDTPQNLVMKLSRLKAEAVCKQTKEKVLVIGADTIVYNNGVVLGKPKNSEEAFNMIKDLQGGMHEVYTGVTFIGSDGLEKSFFEKTRVFCYSMSEDEILKYIETRDPFDKAGGYGIQGPFAAYVERIEGDYNNVVGLPVARLYQEIKKYLV